MTDDDHSMKNYLSRDVYDGKRVMSAAEVAYYKEAAKDVIDAAKARLLQKVRDANAGDGVQTLTGMSDAERRRILLGHSD